ncbi:MAG: hypothetical protein OXU61_02505 [Gammaproteobacteria bacterium]|nr:hypothetical protein [Gammaproteobacteria bacterium]
MKDAAKLLHSGQEKLDAVLVSAGKVIEVTERFSRECGEIVDKLSATDIDRHFEEIKAEVQKNAKMASESAKNTTDRIIAFEADIKRIEGKIQSMDKQSKLRQILTMAFAILTLVAVLSRYL